MFTLWFFHIYVTTFLQHLQMEYTSLSWDDVRLHKDRLHEFCNPVWDRVTNEHWYVWFVQIAGHFICLCSWMVTMCDIWPVVGVSSMMNATCGTGPYISSWAFVSNSNFNGVPVAQTLVSNEDHYLPYTYWFSNCHST